MPRREVSLPDAFDLVLGKGSSCALLLPCSPDRFSSSSESAKPSPSHSLMLAAAFAILVPSRLGQLASRGGPPRRRLLR